MNKRRFSKSNYQNSPLAPSSNKWESPGAERPSDCLFKRLTNTNVHPIKQYSISNKMFSESHHLCVCDTKMAVIVRWLRAEIKLCCLCTLSLSTNYLASSQCYFCNYTGFRFTASRFLLPLEAKKTQYPKKPTLSTLQHFCVHVDIFGLYIVLQILFLTGLVQKCPLSKKQTMKYLDSN